MRLGKTFFIVVPDSDAARSVIDAVVADANVVLSHPSGRPWLLAAGPEHQVVHARGRHCLLAVIGSSDASPESLESALDRVRTPADLALVRRRISGSFSVVGSFDGAVYAAGAAVETTKLFHSRVAGVHVVCDRADILAQLGEFSLDHAGLALRLASGVPYPCTETPIWRDVTPLPGHDCLHISRDGLRLQTQRWWWSPPPTLSRKEGAANLRSALADAVATRTRHATNVACDLSGGLDSTPLCFFAAEGPNGVTARTYFNGDPGGGEDLRWAREALPHMPGVHTHVVTSTDEMPDFYGGLEDIQVHLDEPTQAYTAGPRILHGLADDHDRGITVHLNGLGGDHLLRGLRGWEHTLLRTQPIKAWRRARANDIPSGIPARTTLRQLIDRRSYRQWLMGSLDEARRGVQGPDVPRINDWSPPLHLPGWLSRDAREAVVQSVLLASETATPLDSTLAGHLDLYSLRDAGRLVRTASQLGQHQEVSYEAPLLDDHVVEAVLSVRREDRDSPLEWKPMMKSAMATLLPESYLRRTSKIGGAPQAVRGWATHQERLVSLCEESGLHEAGLVDIDRFVRATRPSSTSPPTNRMHGLINVALFLRTMPATLRTTT